MSQFIPHVPTRIKYEGNDVLIHTSAHPQCSDLTCPCHTEQGLWTGALLSIDRTITTKQRAVRQQGEPTEILPPAPREFDDLVHGATYHLPHQVQRRRVTWWHRLKRWFSLENLADWIEEGIEGVKLGLAIAIVGLLVVLAMLIVAHHILGR